MRLYGGIEAGGTKFICIVASGPDNITAEARFPTTTPKETLDRVVGFFREQMRKEKIMALGVASFGPVDLKPGSPKFGFITSTPKPGWAGTNIAGFLKKTLGLPVGFDTDVNGAALAEHKWGAARGLDTFIYLTVGTGVGGGGMIGGKLMHGLVHPEMGHIKLPHDPTKDSYPGFCPFHGNCLEGMTAGPALEKRWGQKAETLPPEHPAWDLEAHYLAIALVNFICTISPEKIIMGGGVMSQDLLFPLIRKKVAKMLNGYIKSPALLENIDGYIVPPQLDKIPGPRGKYKLTGALGAIALAMEKANNSR